LLARSHDDFLLVEGTGVEHRLGVGLAAEHHHEVGCHRSLALFVKLDDAVIGELLECHVDHAHGTLHDLLAGRDDRFGLLAAQHRLCDLGRVGKVGESGVIDKDAGGGEPVLEFGAQCVGDLLDVGAQRDGDVARVVILHVVVGVDAGDVAKGGLGLHAHVALVVIHVEDGLGGVAHAPYHDGRDLYGVAHLVVDLQPVTVERAGARGDLGAACVALEVCALGALLVGLHVCTHAVRRESKAARVEGGGPTQALVADGAHVLAEEHADAHLAGLQREEAVGEDHADGQDEPACDHLKDGEGGRGHTRVVCGGQRHDGRDEHEDKYDIQCDGDEEHDPTACSMGLLLDAHGRSFPCEGLSSPMEALPSMLVPL